MKHLAQSILLFHNTQEIGKIYYHSNNLPGSQKARRLWLWWNAVRSMMGAKSRGLQNTGIPAVTSAAGFTSKYVVIVTFVDAFFEACCVWKKQDLDRTINTNYSRLDLKQSIFFIPPNEIIVYGFLSSISDIGNWYDIRIICNTLKCFTADTI